MKNRKLEKDYTPEGYIRTTFYLKKELRKRIKEEALVQGGTITSYINNAIEQQLGWRK